jgi:hypothetical protein
MCEPIMRTLNLMTFRSPSKNVEADWACLARDMMTWGPSLEPSAEVAVNSSVTWAVFPTLLDVCVVDSECRRVGRPSEHRACPRK